MNANVRYRAFKLPKSGHWGLIDRRIKRFIIGVICEDEAAARALAKLLNGEAAKWGDPPEQPSAVIVPFIYRVRDTHPTTFAISEPPKPEAPPSSGRRFSLGEYVDRAPASERRLIARLRATAAAD